MRKLALIVLATSVFASSASAREGFGFSKKSVTMNRTRPPALNTSARRIKVVAGSDRSKESDDAASLKRYTEEVLLAGAGTLAEQKPETTIRLSVDRLDSHETWETKQDYEYRKVGTKEEWNDKKKKYETKDVWDNVPVTKNVKVLKASLTGAYDITDRNGRIIDSGDLSGSFSQKYEEGVNSATPSKVEEDLLHKAAGTVGSRLVPTRDRIFVIVPKGSFEAFIPLAESNTWDRYLAAVQAVPENRNASQEAYRQYALGVAKEGLAYSLDDPRRAADLLREAVGHYQKAIQDNPGEKIFTETYDSMLSSRIPASMPRAQASLAAYETWTAGKHIGSTSTQAAAKESSGPMTNQTLIEMAKAGLTDENLMLAIDDADAVSFDTSPSALITLAKGGVSKTVIAHMQKRAKKK